MARIPYVDPDICIGTIACIETSPKVFRLNDEGKAEVYDPDGDNEDNIQRAIDSCPVRAISWKEV